MNYRLIRSAARGTSAFSGRRAALALLALLGVLYLFPPHFLFEGAAFAAAPLWRLGNAVAAAATHALGFFSSAEALTARIKVLEEQLAAREGESRERAALLAENAELRVLSLRSTPVRRLLLAAVLATPPRSPYDTVILDAGARAGVGLSDEVFNRDVLVGEIEAIRAETSVARFFSSPGRKIAVSILEGQTATTVEAEGQGGGVLLARLPREVAVSEGDAVRLSERPLAIFGSVAAIVGNETEPFKKIYIKHPVALSGLRFLSIQLGAPESE